MKATTRVDLHCHSTCSDGALPPRELAERLAAAGVAVASLTDHDTVEGLPAFSQALARRDVGFIPGVEITTQCEGEEAHLLAYGFDSAHAELQETLRSLRQARTPAVHSITDALRARGPSRAGEANGEARSAAPTGRLDIADAIALVHRAGGRAFLAHPLVLRPDLDDLATLLAGLKAKGLDGIEAYYGPLPGEARRALHALAKKMGLLVSGGADRHEAGAPDAPEFGVEMPTEAWGQFRGAVFASAPPAPERAPDAARPLPHPLKWRHFLSHILFPTLLAIALFLAAIFAVFLPTFERSLVERKREMIRELTNSAWSILAHYEREERAGALSRARAQEMARLQVGALRYGREGKDYFWLQDMHPRMVMHPYRKDLNGKDLLGFRDARGVRIFVEFADLVRRQREGYLAYVWQWKDDPKRLAPKESYIKGFAPWGWVIGTGLYTEDVRHEISRIERSLVHTSLAISAIMALLLLYVLQQGLRLERDRAEAEEGLRESTDRYRALVEATTEGALLVLEGRCRYGNPPLLEMLGYSPQELELLDVSDVLPAGEENEAAHALIGRLLPGEGTAGGFEGTLRRRDGSRIRCVLALSPITFAERSGFILLAKDVSPKAGARRERLLHQLGQVAEGAPLGLFRARAAGRGSVLEANPAAEQILRPTGGPGEAETALADLFRDAAEYEEFLAQLHREGAAGRHLHLFGEGTHPRTVALRAHLARGENDQAHFLDGTLEDITDREKQEAEREALVERLQTSLLFLHQPVAQGVPGAFFCGVETPIRQVAGQMSAQGATAALVQSDAGDVLGMVTDRDLSARVLAAGTDPREPIYRVMSAPLITIAEDARVYEALLLMEQHGVQHLAVKDDAGRITGVIRSKDLLQFHSYGAIVLTREIARAATAEDVVRWCRRAPALVGALLECGAHPRHITRMITAICDAATERFLALAADALGPAPARFVFLALGSQGRQEQTLYSDQDNALLYAETEDPEAPSYFQALGERVCGWLDEAGYPFCRGSVMARNPRWCQPLPEWKRNFSEWIRKAEPEQLLEFSIFFDFRAVCGEQDLSRELRRHVNEALRACPAFFPHFAQNSLLFRPPLGLFGQIVAGGRGTDRPGLLNLKDAMMPIVNFARLYALRHDVEETHTLDRLDALAERKVLSEASHQEIAAAYEFLMRLRLRHQAGAIRAGQTPDNVINHRKLGSIEETLLKQSFAQIAAVQKRIGFDFLGGNS